MKNTAGWREERRPKPMHVTAPRIILMLVLLLAAALWGVSQRGRHAEVEAPAASAPAP